jgi:DnaJ domain
MKSKNYYEVLGIRPTASNDEIELAYRGRRTQYHPDKYAKTDEKTIAWATAEMQAVNEAYKFLSDATARTVYDKEMVDADSGNDLTDGDVDSESAEEESASFEDFPEFYKHYGLQAKDRLNGFSAIQTPTVDTPPLWKKSTVSPAPLPSDVHESVRRMKMKRVSGSVLLLFSALSLINFPLFYPAWVLLLAASLLILFAKPNEVVQLEETRRRVNVEQKKLNYEKELIVWDEKASGIEVHNYRDNVIKTTKKYISFVADLERRAIQVIKKNMGNQLDDYLRRMSVRDGAITGVGPSRKEALIRHGIKSAEDVKRSNFIGRDGYKIPGIGESVYNCMVEWKNSCIEEFEVDWTHSNLVEKLTSLFDEYKEKTTAYDSLTGKANHVLTQKIADLEGERLRLIEPMQMAMAALTQAERDHKLLTTSRIGTIAVVATWVFVCTVSAKPILEYLDNNSHASRPSTQAISPSTAPSSATVSQNINATTNPINVTATSNVEANSKSLESVASEPSEKRVNVDASDASKVAVNVVLEKSERVQGPAELEVKQYVEPRPARVAPVAPVAPIPARVILNGKWSGTLSCGEYVGTRTVKNPSPWTEPVTMKVDGKIVEWKRIKEDYSETLNGTFTVESGFVLSGEGYFKNTPDRPWKTKVEAQLINDLPKMSGIATIFGVTGEVIRNCRVQMDLG